MSAKTLPPVVHKTSLTLYFSGLLVTGLHVLIAVVLAQMVFQLLHLLTKWPLW